MTLLRRLAPFALLLLVLVGCQQRIQLHGFVFDPPETVADFTLTDENNQPFRLSDHKGKVVLLFFGYTHCPDVCPGTLAVWKEAHSLLGDAAAETRFVFVTVDPERDTPERLAMHVNAFSPDFIGLTGTPEALQPVYDAFHIAYEKDTESDTAVEYLMGHTAAVMVVDPEGRLRSMLPFGVTGEDVAADVRALLR